MSIGSFKKLFVSTLAALLTQTAIAQIYRCDENGKTTYSERPCSNTAKKTNISSSPSGGTLASANERRRLFLLKHKDIKPVYQSAIEAGVVIPGMTEEQALASLGEPTKRNLTQTRNRSFWQWVYEGPLGNSSYIYIEDGVVVGSN